MQTTTKDFCRGGGCTAKLGAGVLKRVLSGLPEQEKVPELLVGFDAADDAAVYRIDEHTAIVQTLDFFPPMVEDPYLFGQIAAANALSDIWAMGGRPITALNIVCFPQSMDLNVLGDIMRGGQEKVQEAGAVLCGGHSIQDNDVKYGLSVNGIIEPEKVLKNIGAQPGDVLVLTKPLGTGIVCTAGQCAEMFRETDPKLSSEIDAALGLAVDSMRTLNKYAAEVLAQYEVHACTDVTGFGLLGHLTEMLGESVSAEINVNNVPHFAQVPRFIEEFFLTAGGQRNRNFVGEKVVFEQADFWQEELVFDPQTSGGLLAAVRPEDAEEIVRRTREASGLPCAVIGTVTQNEEDKPRIRVYKA